MKTFAAFFSPLSARRAALLSCMLLGATAASAQTITGFSPTYGAVGSDVVITGTGFLTVKSVVLNGQRMRVKSNTGTALTVTVPAAASTGPIRITTGSGTVLTGKGYRVTRVSTSFAFPTASSAVATGVGNLGDYSTPTIADLDNDGLLDLIIGYGDGANTTNGGTLRRFEQTSATDGNFASSTTLTPRTLTVGPDASAATNPAITVANYAKPWLTDLDGDGLLDLLVGETTGTVVRYEQSSATFPNNFVSYGVLFANPDATPANRYYARPTVTDLDGDGLLDILVGGSDGRLRHYEQKTANAAATADFTDNTYLKTGAGVVIDGGNVSKAQVLDIDGDGLLDMLVGNAAGQVLQYKQSAVDAVTFDQVGTGSFNGIALGNGQYAAPLMADVDGDGLLDLLLGNYNLSTGDVQHYEQNVSTPTPLPVVLSAFTGQTTTSGAQLRWTTAQEVQSAEFVVERSADGRSFAAVARIAAAGTSTVAHAYSYLDASAESKAGTVHYYRLRQVDLDGTVAYSPVVTLSRPAASTAGAYPNPFTDALYVALPGSMEAQPATVQLFSLTGQPVYTGQLQLGAVAQAVPNLPALAPGIYVLRLTTAAGTTSQRISRR